MISNDWKNREKSSSLLSVWCFKSRLNNFQRNFMCFPCKLTIFIFIFLCHSWNVKTIRFSYHTLEKYIATNSLQLSFNAFLQWYLIIMSRRILAVVPHHYNISFKVFNNNCLSGAIRSGSHGVFRHLHTHRSPCHRRRSSKRRKMKIRDLFSARLKPQYRDRGRGSVLIVFSRCPLPCVYIYNSII